MSAKPPLYECAECKLAVLVTPDGEVIKGCACKAAVVGNMTATVRGRGITQTK